MSDRRDEMLLLREEMEGAGLDDALAPASGRRCTLCGGSGEVVPGSGTLCLHCKGTGDEPEGEIAAPAPAEETDPATDILGALRASLKNNPAFRAAIEKRMAQRRPVAQRMVASTKARQWAMPFGPVEVPPGATVNVQRQAEVLFRGERLRWTGAPGDELYLAALLFVGNKLQYAYEPVSMASFIEMMTSASPMDTCDPALFITWAVANRGTTARVWGVEIMGRAVM